ncbi:MAG: hypothetical protein EOO05_06485 [Chitinophagaceae bacterium]|nr:MAG: hypothetical protein EOO05_06485 [Chitinophagaceae bacterium]
MFFIEAIFGLEKMFIQGLGKDGESCPDVRRPEGTKMGVIRPVGVVVAVGRFYSGKNNSGRVLTLEIWDFFLF